MVKTLRPKGRKYTEDRNGHKGVHNGSTGMQVHGMYPTQTFQGTLCSLARYIHAATCFLLGTWLLAKVQAYYPTS